MSVIEIAHLLATGVKMH